MSIPDASGTTANASRGKSDDRILGLLGVATLIGVIIGAGLLRRFDAQGG